VFFVVCLIIILLPSIAFSKGNQPSGPTIPNPQKQADEATKAFAGDLGIILTVVWLIAVALFAASAVKNGALLMFSASSQKAEQSKQGFKKAIIGLIIIILAGLIVTLFMKMLGVQDVPNFNWF